MVAGLVTLVTLGIFNIAEEGPGASPTKPLVAAALVASAVAVVSNPRLSQWFRDLPGWLVRDGLVAVVVGAVVAAGSVWGQARIDDERTVREQRLENLRFVRERSSKDPNQARTFREIDLQDQNLTGLKLHGADFAYANLRGADIGLADLRDANLFHSDLRDAALDFANLTNAGLGDADLRNARAGYADLTGANLIGANLKRADLSHTFFVQADLALADLSDATLIRADLTGADLAGANLGSERPFDDADLTGAILTDIYYDASTTWPEGLRPPPSRQSR